MGEYFDDGTGSENPRPTSKWVMWVVIGFAFWLLLGMCAGPDQHQANVTHAIHLKEPMNVDVALMDKEVTVIHVERYRWTTYGSGIVIEALGRTITIPLTSIKFIESLDMSQTDRQRGE